MRHPEWTGKHEIPRIAQPYQVSNLDAAVFVKTLKVSHHPTSEALSPTSSRSAQLRNQEGSGCVGVPAKSLDWFVVPSVEFWVLEACAVQHAGANSFHDISRKRDDQDVRNDADNCGQQQQQ